MHHVASSVVEKKTWHWDSCCKTVWKRRINVGVDNVNGSHTNWKSSWYTACSSEDMLVGWNLICFSPAGPHTVSWNSLQLERNPSIASDTSSTHMTPVEEINGNFFWMYWWGRKMKELVWMSKLVGPESRWTQAGNH